MIVEHFRLLEINLRMRRFISTIMERAVARPAAGTVIALQNGRRRLRPGA
jgi:hypothetical protein